MEKELSIGSIVHLNSGSPDLRVVRIVNDDVTVEWHDEEKSELCQYTAPKGNFRAA